MNDLLQNLRRFIAAGDESRSYQLTFAEVVQVVDEVERLRGGTVAVPVYSFAEIRQEVREKRKAEAIAKGIDAEIKDFVRPKDVS